jgi:hypothetical protein
MLPKQYTFTGGIMKQFRITVFGKEGCLKCNLLKQRISKLLTEEKYSNFDMEYVDIKTLNGLVELCKCEVLNPQKIPAFIIKKRNAFGNFDFINVKTSPHKYSDEINTILYIQTDYSNVGKGLINYEKIVELLDIALEQYQEEMVEVAI